MSSVGFISLGCPKALVDSERILTGLRESGYRISPSYQGADVVIVNTCGFIDSARAESLEAIGEAINENGKVIVTGCLGVNAETIQKAHPQVLHISGPQQYEQVINAVLEHAPIDKKHDPYIDLIPPQGIKLTPPHYAYLKIAEGCNHHCSFCIIPTMRGRLVSRRLDDVLAEATRLAEAGVKELLIISQDTSAYGVDLHYASAEWRGRQLNTNLFDLCTALGELGIWIRLHYVYPYPHVDNLIPLMADGKVLPYLDVPFQHGSPRILKLMRRPAAAENNLERIQSWRKICPDITIRSTFIVGFPGETEADFEVLIEFLRQARLDRVGCFQYSPVSGASANKLAGHVDEKLKQERWEYFMKTQAEISQQKLQSKIGRNLEVIIDEVNADGMVGRSYADAPEIDGKVFMQSKKNHNVGEIVTARINKSADYDVWGSVIEPEAEVV